VHPHISASSDISKCAPEAVSACDPWKPESERVDLEYA
jgi:hypothetical protein